MTLIHSTQRLRLLALAIIAAGRVSAGETWTCAYEAGRLPVESKPRWSGGGSDHTSADLIDGTLHIADSGDAKGDLHFYSRSWNADPDLGATVEVRVKVKQCTSRAGVVLLIADGIRETALTFYPDHVDWDHDRRAIDIDLASAFHTFRVRVRDTHLTLWVDGKAVVDEAEGFRRPAYHGRNCIGFGSCSSAALSEAWWDFVRYQVTRPKVDLHPGVEHHIVYKREGVYACFPSFIVRPDGALWTRFGTRVRRSHIDPTGGSGQRQSLDGGRTWTDLKQPWPFHEHDRRGDGSYAYAAAWGWRYVPAERKEELQRHGYVVRDVRPGTVAYLSGAYARHSTDGVHWQTTEIDTPPQASLMTFNQSSRVHLPGGVRLTAVYGRRAPGDRPTSWVLRSTDEGATWKLLAIAAPRPLSDTPTTQPLPERIRKRPLPATEDGLVGFTETALCAVGADEVLAMMRPDPDRLGYLFQSRSRDAGATWSRPRRTPMWGYPAHLLVLQDGRLLCTYGYRRAPMGIRACLSEDGGQTWDIEREIVLRADGEGNGGDLGYPITQQLQDGTLVTVYYFTTADGITHIAATRWQAP